ncbi:hypothetical protein V8G54_024984 [Vigna mungo]|uniref:Methyltransferase domain-containing protein n=1 Tax=Vigna mungo TaxID=3915 RepID=A0AAQ3N6K6_VIGMU
MEDTPTPSTALAYLNPSYWDERFSKEEEYEWFKDYSHFRHLIQPHLTPHSAVTIFGGTWLTRTYLQVLELGCGNSQMCEQLHKDGTTNITCIDLSHVAVQNMQKRLLSRGFKDIKVLQADMLELPFGDECFDLVIEKGTMDVLFVDSGDPWNPKPETLSKVMATLKGVHRVLKAGGTFISVTFGQPHFRRPIFNAPDFTWSVEWTTFGEGGFLFSVLYVRGIQFWISILDGALGDIWQCGQRSSYDDVPPTKGFEAPSINLLHEELESEDFAFRINVEELNC